MASSNQPEKDQEILKAANHEPEEGLVDDASSMAAPSNNEQQVIPESWQACAGSLVDIPKKDSLVYYFPQGHMEHVQEVLLHYPVRYGCCLCRVIDVSFLAHPETDQVFVKFLLHPISIPNPISFPNDPNPISIPNTNRLENSNPNRILINPFTIPNDDFVSFIKVLTEQDVSKKFIEVLNPLREYIFSLIPETLSHGILLSFIDIHGKIWEIMFKSRNSFHVLTDGWNDFVRAKNLTPGDSIVFMLKKSTLQYYIGIRRAVVNTGTGPKDVEDAIQKARDMKRFEVVYYPNLGLPEFVVPKEKVDAALNVPWRREMPVRIAYDTEIARPRKRWHSGRLLNDIDRNNNMINSPDYWWQVLQVQWDVSRAYLKKKLSPWEVEV
ncbi:unnamed protein product [Amaranthus hypochondriacus]